METMSITPSVPLNLPTLQRQRIRGSPTLQRQEQLGVARAQAAGAGRAGDAIQLKGDLNRGVHLWGTHGVTNDPNTWWCDLPKKENIMYIKPPDVKRTFNSTRGGVLIKSLHYNCSEGSCHTRSSSVTPTL